MKWTLFHQYSKPQQPFFEASASLHEIFFRKFPVKILFVQKNKMFASDQFFRCFLINCIFSDGESYVKLQHLYTPA